MRIYSWSRILINIIWSLWKIRMKLFFILFGLLLWKLLIAIFIKTEVEIFTPNYFNPSHKQWLIISIAIDQPYNHYHLEDFNLFNVIIISDKELNKLPKNYFYFLGPNAEINFPYSILDFLEGLAARKMIAYLLAIEFGAKYILEYEYTGIPIKFRNIIHFDNPYKLLYQSNKSLVNSFAVFGQKNFHSGYDDDLQKSSLLRSEFTISKMSIPLVQNGVAYEVDNSNYFIQPNKSNRLMFDMNGPSFALPSNSFITHHSTNVAYSANAFWSLFLPRSYSTEVADIYRTLWLQKLLWLTSNYYSLGPPLPIIIKNEEIIKKRFIKKDELVNIRLFSEFLLKWTCQSTSKNEENYFLTCMKEMADNLVEKQFWSKIDLALFKAWLKDLHNVGYSVPKFKLNSITDNQEVTNGLSYVVYHPSRKSDTSFNSVVSLKRKKWCPRPQYSVKPLANSNVVKFDKMVLVVGIYKDPVEVVPLFTALYADKFEAIYFCSSVKIHMKFIDTWKVSYLYLKEESVSVISCLSAIGHLNIVNVDFIYVPDNAFLLSDSLAGKQRHLFWMSESFDVYTTSDLRSCANGDIRCSHISIKNVEQIYTLISDSNKSSFLSDQERIKLLTCLNKMKHDPIWYSVQFQTWLVDIVVKLPSHTLHYLTRLRQLFSDSELGLVDLKAYEIMIIFFLECDELTGEYLAYVEDGSSALNKTLNDLNKINYIFPVKHYDSVSPLTKRIICETRL